ncbi:hypothetical protein CEXT_686491 [Caerostris extrusa]|uniref:Uncharacterized protein n=1 Tax=Caerostris extrusa TaxID=172846 RepID=A0AAV4RLT5_CAEEX|nr:hypothetical protein CEXT_686491 [Caerostris extrusa]
MDCAMGDIISKSPILQTSTIYEFEQKFSSKILTKHNPFFLLNRLRDINIKIISSSNPLAGQTIYSLVLQNIEPCGQRFDKFFITPVPPLFEPTLRSLMKTKKQQTVAAVMEFHPVIIFVDGI